MHVIPHLFGSFLAETFQPLVLRLGLDVPKQFSVLFALLLHFLLEFNAVFAIAVLHFALNLDSQTELLPLSHSLPL